MKQSKVRKYIHKENMNTLRNLPDSAKALIGVYQELTGVRKEEVEYLKS